MKFMTVDHKHHDQKHELTAFLNSQGTLRSGLIYGPVRVQQTAIKTIQANCKQMMQMKVKEAIQYPIASRLDDFHNIYMYTIKTPTDLKLS
ncbi:hypothetical protein P5673_018156 [Acropora cervicornis]|uniref:Uncharacterized protein n=1 Tax=Acropora cervicornis TaxID=6130 RepID=A0AAD9QEN6_ACRCE|nr:hypothetical protein P5673_018156 [Acropora cervicornis]